MQASPWDDHPVIAAAARNGAVATSPSIAATYDTEATSPVSPVPSPLPLYLELANRPLDMDYDAASMLNIGKGKFSTVYRATRRTDGTYVALKHIAISSMDANSRDKCMKEIKLVQSLAHPNIIRYVDGFMENQELVLVFEFAEGGDLRRHLRKAKERSSRFEELVVWKYISQIAGSYASYGGGVRLLNSIA